MSESEVPSSYSTIENIGHSCSLQLRAPANNLDESVACRVGCQSGWSEVHSSYPAMLGCRNVHDVSATPQRI